MSGLLAGLSDFRIREFHPPEICPRASGAPDEATPFLATHGPSRKGRIVVKASRVEDPIRKAIKSRLRDHWENAPRKFSRDGLDFPLISPIVGPKGSGGIQSAVRGFLKEMDNGKLRGRLR